MNKSILLIFISLGLVGCAAAQNGAMIGAYEAIKENDCITAYESLSNAEKYADTTDELAAEISYLRGVCLEKEGKTAEAMGQYLYLIEKYPDSEYSYRVRSKLLLPNEHIEEITIESEI